MSGAGVAQPVLIPAGAVSLHGDLALPDRATGMVIFSHGSGSGRFSPRNQFVALELRKRNIATLLLDLLTEQEDRDYQMRFDIDLLTQRLGHAVRFAGDQDTTRSLPVGLFGASTGAASALRVAASVPDRVCAMVSRGGRPDMTGAALLEKVRSPTLLIVGGNDFGVIELNESARDALTNCTCELTIVPGATHLFEEPGKLEDVAQLAGDWFARYLAPKATGRG